MAKGWVGGRLVWVEAHERKLTGLRGKLSAVKGSCRGFAGDQRESAKLSVPSTKSSGGLGAECDGGEDKPRGEGASLHGRKGGRKRHQGVVAGEVVVSLLYRGGRRLGCGRRRGAQYCF